MDNPEGEGFQKGSLYKIDRTECPRELDVGLVQENGEPLQSLCDVS